ncbi:MAG: YlmC/YmxH family sporulation protein [Bacilli bacterium]
MRLSELQRKDIVNMVDGKKIGKIIDVEIKENDGTMESLVIEKSRYIKNLFNTEGELLIKFTQIKKFGEDVILVDIS